MPTRQQPGSVFAAGDGEAYPEPGRLVQALTRAQLSEPDAAAWQQATAALITAALPEYPDLPAGWAAYAVLLPHADAALPLTGSPMYWVASYLGWSGSHTAACGLFQQILDARQHEHGAEHPDTLNARASLARWTGAAGDMAAARDQFAALLPISKRVLGAGHLHTLATSGSCAPTPRSASRYGWVCTRHRRSNKRAATPGATGPAPGHAQPGRSDRRLTPASRKGPGSV